MRIAKIAALLLVLAFLLCACGARGEVLSYAEEHTHVYGYWYDTTPATCQAEGARVRYCKICHAEQSMTVKVPEDEAKRAHPYEDIRVEPTEKDEGSFSRICSLCGRVDEQAGYVIPPLYALLVDDNTDYAERDGVAAALMSDTATHTVSVFIHGDAAIDATFAQRLSVALVALEHIGADSDTVSQELKNTLGRWLRDGNGDALTAICVQLGMDEAQLVGLVNDRMALLGANFSTTSLRDAAAFSGVTLYGTAVLLAKALDQALLCELFAMNADPYVAIGEEKPALYFAENGVRISALQREGRYVFLLLAGESLATDLELSFYEA